jgi:hypothetical protein
LWGVESIGVNFILVGNGWQLAAVADFFHRAWCPNHRLKPLSHAKRPAWCFHHSRKVQHDAQSTKKLPYILMVFGRLPAVIWPDL